MSKKSKQSAETTQGPGTPAPEQSIRSIKMPAGFDIEASGYSYHQIFAAAVAGHQANKEYCESIGDTSQVDFGDAKDWQRECAFNGVCFAITNNFPSPEAMHNNWMKEKVAAGWQWGVEKNPDATPPTHPCIMPYDQLPEAQRRKDDLFREAVMASLGPKAAATQEPATVSNETKGEPLYLQEFSVCVWLGLSGKNEPELPENFELIPYELAMFFRNEPTAPEHAGLMHLKLKFKTILLPNEDPRRVDLALKIFRTVIAGRDLIEKEDGEKARIAAEQQAAAANPLPKREVGEGPFDQQGDRLELSDIGKAQAARPASQQSTT